MPRTSLYANLKDEILIEEEVDHHGLHDDTPFSPQDAKKFLSSLKERLNESSYMCPAVRMARSITENELEMSSARETSTSEMDDSKVTGKVNFGIHDGLDIERLTQLRKVFFQVRVHARNVVMISTSNDAIDNSSFATR